MLAFGRELAGAYHERRFTFAWFPHLLAGLPVDAPGSARSIGPNRRDRIENRIDSLTNDQKHHAALHVATVVPAIVKTPEQSYRPVKVVAPAAADLYDALHEVPELSEVPRCSRVG